MEDTNVVEPKGSILTDRNGLCLKATNLPSKASGPVAAIVTRATALAGNSPVNQENPPTVVIRTQHNNYRFAELDAKYVVIQE